MRKTLLAVLACLASSALAAPEDGLKCAKIDNDIARLACFDEAFKAIPADATATTGLATDWQVKEETSPVDDRKTLYASIAASSVTSNFIGNADALLVLRCSGGETNFFVATNAYFSDVSSVTVRVGSSPPDTQTQMWDVSDTGNAIGLWRGTNPIKLARALKDKDKFAIRVEGRHRFEAVFDVGAIEPVKKRVGEMCSWHVQ